MAGTVTEADDDDEVRAEINIIPFVDIVLVLLIIFLLSSKFFAAAQIPVELPAAANTAQLVDPTVNVVLTADGALFLDGVALPTTELRGELTRRVNAAPKTRAVIAADKHLPYERVIALIDAVKSAGVQGFALNIEQVPAAP
jgi:biopolymer transport protein ExbD